MSPTTIRRWRAATVAIAPVLLLAAFLSHPYLPGRLPNDEVIAAAVRAGTTRWAVAHLAIGVASGVVVLAFLAIRGHLHDSGEDRWSMFGLPFIIIGSTLFTLLPGLEFAPLAAVLSGGDPVAAQATLEQWFVPLLATGAITFTVGAVGFALAVLRSAILPRELTRMVVAALVVMGAARAVPLAAVQFHVQGVAAIVALWPLAASIARGTQPATRPAGQPRTASLGLR